MFNVNLFYLVIKIEVKLARILTEFLTIWTTTIYIAHKLKVERKHTFLKEKLHMTVVTQFLGVFDIKSIQGYDFFSHLS